MDIQKYLHDFISKSKSVKFTVDDVEKFLSGKTEISRKKIEDYLMDSPYLFVSSVEKDAEKYYVSRDKFFNGAEFIVTPTSFEIEEGVLFSGHRFVPVYCEDLFPTESFQIKTTSGAVVKTKNTQRLK